MPGRGTIRGAWQGRRARCKACALCETDLHSVFSGTGSNTASAGGTDTSRLKTRRSSADLANDSSNDSYPASTFPPLKLLTSTGVPASPPKLTEAIPSRIARDVNEEHDEPHDPSVRYVMCLVEFWWLRDGNSQSRLSEKYGWQADIR